MERRWHQMPAKRDAVQSPQPRRKHSRRSLLVIILLDYLNRSTHVAGDLEHTDSVA
jgi:hypothetical protein